MAERRMFAKTIIDSDAFLEMPISSQVLYFHLAMRADDDGFINKPKTIIRMVGCKDDDMRLLIERKFVIPFDSGVVVIKHWRIHNYIRKDTYSETKYKEEKSKLSVDKNGSYKAVEEGILSICDEPVTNPLHLRNEPVTGTSTQVRLGKDRIGKVSIGEDNKANVEDIENINNISYAQSNGKNAIILADGSVFIVPEKEISILKSAYPKIDVEAEIKKMAAWAMSNPAKRKTRRGIMRFVNSWLSSANDKQPKESKGRVWNEL